MGTTIALPGSEPVLVNSLIWGELFERSSARLGSGDIELLELHGMLGGIDLVQVDVDQRHRIMHAILEATNSLRIELGRRDLGLPVGTDSLLATLAARLEESLRHAEIELRGGPTGVLEDD